MDINKISHTSWNCKYHIVFAPKYRRKAFYGGRRLEIGAILRELCRWKGINILEAEVCIGGYNGGGNGGQGASSDGVGGSGGGGATHIATSSGLLSNVSSSNVLIVAGGGGGGYINSSLSSTSTNSGQRSGNGLAKITLQQ